jgi:hypothetical protein
MTVDTAVGEIDIARIQHLDAVVRHVSIKSWNGAVQSLPRAIFGQRLGHHPRAELVRFEASLEEA